MDNFPNRHQPASQPEAHDSHSDHLVHPSRITVGRFIEEKFGPEHIDRKRSSGRAFYQAILKHVIQPEEVDRIFRRNTADPRKTLHSLPGWPYLNAVRLCDVREDHINQIAEAASQNGYSVETVRHIRSVIGAIFSHAIREKYLVGDNPIANVKPPRRPQRNEMPLAPAEAVQALQLMRYPEKPFILLGAMTGLLPSEIIGLQWRHVNLTADPCFVDNIRIPPLSIAVRKRWYRGELDSVRKNCSRDVALPPALASLILELRSQSRYSRPDDFVLVSHRGTPISHDNLMTQRLRPIARELGVPSISARSFLDVPAVLLSACRSLQAQSDARNAERYAS